MVAPVLIKTYTGSDISRFIPELARLRITVFREYPYLYDGDLSYEEAYLQHYADSQESCLVIAFAGADVIGASTAMPLGSYSQEMQTPFIQQGIPVSSVFYLGESVLLKSFRGQRLGHQFFDERERHARQLNHFSMTAFCSVERSEKDECRPVDYRPLDLFWAKRGYCKQPALVAQFSWQELGEASESPKQMVFWTRDLK